MSDLESDVLERVEVKEPSMYSVLLLNDDYTPMEFVIEILVEIFRKSAPEATKITMDVHREGSGVAGVYIRDIAEMKCKHVDVAAKANKFPLKTTIKAI